MRLSGTWQQPLLVKDSIVGQRYRAGFSGEEFVPEVGRKIHIRISSLGYRGPDRPFAKPAGVRRIALLGDSFTAAIAVEEPDTMAAQLEQRLNAHATEARWEVLNFGIGGFSTAQSLLTWRNFARRFDPDIVILNYYNGNDLWDNDRNLTSYVRPYFSLDEKGELDYHPISEAKAEGTRWLNDHSRLYVWQNQAFAILRQKLRSVETNAPPVAELFDTDPPDPFPEAWRITEKLLATLADEVRASGARFILVDIPAHEEFLDYYWQKLLDAEGAEAPRFDRGFPERQFRDIAARHGIHLVPLLQAFRASPIKNDLHFGGGHWNENGNHLAAETVYQDLHASGLAD